LKLYRKFIKFDRDYSIELEKIETKFDDKFLHRYYNEVYKPTFVEFALVVRDLLAFQNVWEVFYKTPMALEDISSFLLFLKDVGIADFNKNGRVKIIDYSILGSFTKPTDWKNIKGKLEEKVGSRLNLNLPLSHNLGIHHKWDFSVDQLPLTTHSLLKNAEKIAEFFPLKEKILLIGDDDLLSILLAILGYQPFVVDIDERLLAEIKELAGNLDLKIKLRRMDVLKRRRFREKVLSFHTNPPGTLEGVKAFLNFGLESLNKRLGGICFLHVQRDLGNRQIEFQKFISAKSLKILEVVSPLAIYPGSGVGLETDAYWRKLTKNLSGKISISSSFWIMSYVPWKVSRFKMGAYDYVF
jgi:predicted methyltransferase